MTTPGWYPDPGGQRGVFRYWDGSAWSTHTSLTGHAAPPQAQTHPPTSSGQTRRATRGLWVAAVGIVVVALVAWLVTIAVRTATNNPTDPVANPTTTPCPPQQKNEPIAHPNDGRIHGGQLSYPTLGAPWQPRPNETRVPYGRDLDGQSVITEADYNQQGDYWGVSIVVGGLVAGDGFFAPEEGARIMTKCLIGSLYNNIRVTDTELVSQAAQVNDKPAWLIESHLAFEVPQLQTKGELLIVMVVATSPESSSLFLAAVPDNAPQYLPAVRQTMAQLEVSS